MNHFRHKQQQQLKKKTSRQLRLLRWEISDTCVCCKLVERSELSECGTLARQKDEGGFSFTLTMNRVLYIYIYI